MKIVIIDDDENMSILAESLECNGHSVVRYKTIMDAKNNFSDVVQVDLVITDVIFNSNERNIISKLDVIRFINSIRSSNVKIPIIVYTALQDSHIIENITVIENVIFVSKWNVESLKSFIAKINSILGLSNPMNKNIFIVHGRDETEKLHLKNYLQNVLQLPEPIILHEQPNRGRTIIEKIEYYTLQVDIVFVLLTPDDTGALLSDDNDMKYRARQNVIFELGYFLGVLGRKSGKIILLHKGSLELPSDLYGITYINIDNGIMSAGEEIRKELSYDK